MLTQQSDYTQNSSQRAIHSYILAGASTESHKHGTHKHLPKPSTPLKFPSGFGTGTQYARENGCQAARTSSVTQRRTHTHFPQSVNILFHLPQSVNMNFFACLHVERIQVRVVASPCNLICVGDSITLTNANSNVSTHVHIRRKNISHPSHFYLLHTLQWRKVITKGWGHPSMCAHIGKTERYFKHTVSHNALKP